MQEGLNEAFEELRVAMESLKERGGELSDYLKPQTARFLRRAMVPSEKEESRRMKNAERQRRLREKWAKERSVAHNEPDPCHNVVVARYD